MTRAQLPTDEGYLVLPRKLSWAAVAAIVTYALGAAGYALSMHSSLGMLEAKASTQATHIERLNGERDRTIRLEEKVDGISRLLQRMEDKLDRARP